MKILERIDEVIEKLESPIDKRIQEARKIGGKEYDDFFKSMLKKWKIKSYKDLPKNKQKAFFDAIDSGWNSKKEKGKDGKK